MRKPFLLFFIFSCCAHFPASAQNAVLWEGFEGYHAWRAASRDWKPGDSSRSAEAVAVYSTQGNRSLKCTFSMNGKEGASFSLNREIDWSRYGELRADFRNEAGRTLGIAFVIQTSDEWLWQESRPVDLPPGESRDVSFVFTEAGFKSQLTGWSHAAPLRDRRDIRRVVFVFYGPVGAGGSVYADNIRLVDPSGRVAPERPAAERTAARETASAETPSRSEEPRPLFHVLFMPLGFLQYGPMAEIELRIAGGFHLAAHVRFHGLGLLSHLTTTAATELWSAAGGAGARFFFDAGGPHAWYLGLMAEAGVHGYYGDLYTSDAYHGESVFLVAAVNGGFRWRFGHFIIQAGAYLGVAPVISNIWSYENPAGYRSGEKPVLFFGTAEVSLGFAF